MEVCNLHDSGVLDEPSTGWTGVWSPRISLILAEGFTTPSITPAGRQPSKQSSWSMTDSPERLGGDGNFRAAHPQVGGGGGGGRDGRRDG